MEGRALPTRSTSGLPGRPESQNLADILERLVAVREMAVEETYGEPG